MYIYPRVHQQGKGVGNNRDVASSIPVIFSRKIVAVLKTDNRRKRCVNRERYAYGRSKSHAKRIVRRRGPGSIGVSSDDAHAIHCIRWKTKERESRRGRNDGRNSWCRAAGDRDCRKQTVDPAGKALQRRKIKERVKTSPANPIYDRACNRNRFCRFHYKQVRPAQLPSSHARVRNGNTTHVGWITERAGI